MNRLDTNIVPCKRLDYENVACTLWHLNMVFGPKHHKTQDKTTIARLMTKRGNVLPEPSCLFLSPPSSQTVCFYVFFFLFCRFPQRPFLPGAYIMKGRAPRPSAGGGQLCHGRPSAVGDKRQRDGGFERKMRSWLWISGRRNGGGGGIKTKTIRMTTAAKLDVCVCA